MHASYHDILSRISDPPLWWDQNGVPRFDPFQPCLCPDIYAEVVVLLEIACQDCEEHFCVEMHYGIFTPMSDTRHPKMLHYGDPPRHGPHCIGETMNCDDLRVLEVWKRGSSLNGWDRCVDLEGDSDQRIERPLL